MWKMCKTLCGKGYSRLRTDYFLCKPVDFLPSLDKGRHGFGGQKCAHTASSPLTIRQVFSAGLFLSGRISAPAKLLRTCQRCIFGDFWFLSCRLAGASQGEKSKKRRKDTLAGVFALVKRWYIFVRPCKTGERRHLQRPGKYDKIGIVPCGTDDYTARRRAGGMIWQERAHTTTRAYPA